TRVVSPRPWSWFRIHRQFFFSSRRRHTRFSRDWSSDVCSSDLLMLQRPNLYIHQRWYGLGLPDGLEVAELANTCGCEFATYTGRSEERRVGKECSSRWLGGP